MQREVVSYESPCLEAGRLNSASSIFIILSYALRGLDDCLPDWWENKEIGLTIYVLNSVYKCRPMLPNIHSKY